jgi:hypothetical protein
VMRRYAASSIRRVADAVFPRFGLSLLLPALRSLNTLLRDNLLMPCGPHSYLLRSHLNGKAVAVSSALKLGFPVNAVARRKSRWEVYSRCGRPHNMFSQTVQAHLEQLPCFLSSYRRATCKEEVTKDSSICVQLKAQAPLGPRFQGANTQISAFLRGIKQAPSRQPPPFSAGCRSLCG